MNRQSINRTILSRDGYYEYRKQQEEEDEKVSSETSRLSKLHLVQGIPRPHVLKRTLKVNSGLTFLKGSLTQSITTVASTRLNRKPSEPAPVRVILPREGGQQLEAKKSRIIPQTEQPKDQIEFIERSVQLTKDLENAIESVESWQQLNEVILQLMNFFQKDSKQSSFLAMSLENRMKQHQDIELQRFSLFQLAKLFGWMHDRNGAYRCYVYLLNSIKGEHCFAYKKLHSQYLVSLSVEFALRFQDVDFGVSCILDFVTVESQVEGVKKMLCSGLVFTPNQIKGIYRFTQKILLNRRSDLYVSVGAYMIQRKKYKELNSLYIFICNTTLNKQSFSNMMVKCLQDLSHWGDVKRVLDGIEKINDPNSQRKAYYNLCTFSKKITLDQLHLIRKKVDSLVKAESIDRVYYRIGERYIQFGYHNQVLDILKDLKKKELNKTVGFDQLLILLSHQKCSCNKELYQWVKEIEDPKRREYLFWQINRRV